jgi:flagellar protein FlbD
LEDPLITLHRFNSRKEFVINADVIKYIEETPDTVITLMNNEKILVDETIGDVVASVIDYARCIRRPIDYLSQPQNRVD